MCVEGYVALKGLEGLKEEKRVNFVGVSLDGKRNQW